jgi:hypothetical protein
LPPLFTAAVASTPKLWLHVPSPPTYTTGFRTEPNFYILKQTSENHTWASDRVSHSSTDSLTDTCSEKTIAGTTDTQTVTRPSATAIDVAAKYPFEKSSLTVRSRTARRMKINKTGAHLQQESRKPAMKPCEWHKTPSLDTADSEQTKLWKR